MNLNEARSLLDELAASTNAVRTEVGTSGRKPHDYAYLELTSESIPAEYAVISTPGDGRFEECWALKELEKALNQIPE